MSDMNPDLFKVILVTGASQGIVFCALGCAKAGAEVIITGRTMGALEELDDDINAVGGSATIVELDQTDTAAMARLGQAIGSRWGRLDGFVANAGQLGQMAPMPHIDPEIFERTILVNVTSVWHQIAAFDGLLRRPGRPRCAGLKRCCARRSGILGSLCCIQSRIGSDGPGLGS